jgi:GNAT superfamily N-acetyltransferase
MPDIRTRPLEKADYDYIVRVIDQWWGGPTSALAHPVYFYELGEHAMVAEVDGRVVGFLFGFTAPDAEAGALRTSATPGGGAKSGYVHLVGIDPDYRRKHVGTLLYRTFEDRMRTLGIRRLKAITTLGNDGSVRFHEALGWASRRIDDYAGPGRPRIIFAKELDPRDLS